MNQDSWIKDNIDRDKSMIIKDIDNIDANRLNKEEPNECK